MIASILSGVINAALGLLRIVLQGVTAIVASPAALATVLVLGLASLAYGIKLGHRATEHRVIAAEVRHAAAITKIQTDAAAAASEKRNAAEEAAKAAPAPETPAEVIALCQRSASCRERSK